MFRLTSILTSRFLISLQEIQRNEGVLSQSFSLDEVAFRPHTSRSTNYFIGSLGAQPSFRADSEEDEETVSSEERAFVTVSGHPDSRV